MSKVLGEGVTAVGLDVGIVCQAPPSDVGGVETHLRELTRGLTARGHRVHVLTLDREGGGAPYAIRSGEDPSGAHLRRMAPPEELASFAALVHDERADDAVLAWLAETPCDLIHVHHLTGFGAGALRAIADMGRPLVVSLHDAWLFCPCGQPLHALDDPAARLACAARLWPRLLPSGGGAPLGPTGAALAGDGEAVEARRAFALECLDLAHHIWVPSAAALELCAAAGVDAARLEVIEPGLDLEGLATQTAAARRAAPPRPADTLRLGVLGPVLPGKGVVELMEAVLAADIPNLELHVHGPLAPFHGSEEHLERARELARSAARIELHGAYAPAELPGILAALDGVAAPSTWPEFYGLGPREARAAGLPVLVSSSGALPPVAADGGAGRVLAAGDRDAWARALAEFAADADLRARWGAGPRAVRSSADMTLEIERRYVELVDEVTGHVPELRHPVEGREPPPASAPAPAAKRRGLLGRLFGR